MMLSAKSIGKFIRHHSLPPSFLALVEKHYATLVDWLHTHESSTETMFLGINGAQGTGKSTLAAFLKLALETMHSWHVAVLSIDDFYLTKSERHELSKNTHPLLATRGVPGTHDIAMLSDLLDCLRLLGEHKQCALPRFDKAIDDRADESAWPDVSGPVDMIVLEGWCVGSTAQPESELAAQVNDLERNEDPSGHWRRFVNDQLKSDYANLFGQLDALVFLQAPSFGAIHRWRLEQEQKLAASAPSDASGIMNGEQVAEFIQYYERITRNNLAVMPGIADVVLELDETHDCVASHYRRKT